MIGSTLSHYRIVSELGRGGMGIVYRAEDTKLDRTVAIKVLPASALASKDDHARFYREAKAAAGLNHPNIAAVYEIDEAVPSDAPHGTPPSPFIAMEFIDGQPLDERIKKAPLKLDQAIAIASQIASALETAHEKGIVHRDIKSANVMMTAKGAAKVLDFGLAKTSQSTMLTRMGSTLGTIAFMSPEQARGEEVDRRTDLWSLGVVLYQMVSGRIPFAADYEQAAVYSILNETPEPLTALRTGVPMGLEWVVNKLLAKKASDRYQNAGDVLVDLRNIELRSDGFSRASASVSSIRPEVPIVPAARADSNIPAPLWALIGALLVIAAWFLMPTSEVEQSRVSTKRLTVPVNVRGRVIAIDIAPRGDLVAVGGDYVTVYDLRSGKSTEYTQAGGVVLLDFSPDAKSLLVTGTSGISRLSLETGDVIPILKSGESGPRATWLDDNRILYEEKQSIFEASIISGESRRVTSPDSVNAEYDHDFPQVLPGGKVLMATAEFRDLPSKIGFWEIESGRNLGYISQPGNRAQLIDDGHLLYETGQNTFVIPFDIESYSQTGPQVPVGNVAFPEEITVSGDGTVVYIGSRAQENYSDAPIVPVILRRLGSSSDITTFEGLPQGLYRDGSISPDGKTAVLVLDSPRSDGTVATDIWMLDFATGTRRAFTLDGLSDFPAWTANGDSILFVRKDRNDEIRIRSADGRGRDQLFGETAVPTFADLAISRTGLMVRIQSIKGLLDVSSEISLFTREADSKIGASVINPRHPSFSPDSRYLAFDDQGQIKVLSVDDPESIPFTVWESGMSAPKWAPDGTMLYALTRSGEPFGVKIQLDPVFSVIGEPEVILGWGGLSTRLFDVFPDGEKFLMPSIVSSSTGSTNGEPSQDSGTAVNYDSTGQTINLNFIINIPGELK